MFCPKCGTKNVDGAKFCTACGNPLPVATAETAPPSGKSGNPAVASGAVPGAAPATQIAAHMPAKAPGTKKKVPIVIGAAAAVVVVVLVAVFVVIPGLNMNSSKNGQANGAVESGSYERSTGASDGKASDKNPFKGAQVGDKVKFGSYEQDGDTSNGEEPIKWRVLAVEGNRALVVSDKALDAHAFNSDYDKGNEWESSDLKNWLENDFATQAFTDDGEKIIDGAPTLLSRDEANEYFKSDEDRVCCPTKWAKENGAGGYNGDGCFWWLRSVPDGTGHGADIVYDVGRLGPGGNSVDITSNAVRPALWVNLQ